MERCRAWQLAAGNKLSHRFSVGASSTGRCQALVLGDMLFSCCGHAQSSVLLQCVCSIGATTNSAGVVLFLLGIVASCCHTWHTRWAFSATQMLLALQVLFSDSMLVYRVLSCSWFVTASAGWGMGLQCTMSKISVMRNLLDRKMLKVAQQL